MRRLRSLANAACPSAVLRAARHLPRNVGLEPRLPAKDRPVIKAIKQLSSQYPRYGYRRIRIFLKRQRHQLGWLERTGCGARPAAVAASPPEAAHCNRATTSATGGWRELSGRTTSSSTLVQRPAGEAGAPLDGSDKAHRNRPIEGDANPRLSLCIASCLQVCTRVRACRAWS